MAELNVTDKKTASGSPTSIGDQKYSVTYDYANDGGTTADTRVLIEFKDAVAIKLMACRVKTALTSGGAATISLGVDAGTEMLSAEALGTFTAGAIVPQDDPGVYYPVAADGKIVLSIGTADLTAGKLELLFDTIAAA